MECLLAWRLFLRGLKTVRGLIFAAHTTKRLNHTSFLTRSLKHSARSRMSKTNSHDAPPFSSDVCANIILVPVGTSSEWAIPCHHHTLMVLKYLVASAHFHISQCDENATRSLVSDKPSFRLFIVRLLVESDSSALVDEISASNAKMLHLMVTIVSFGSMLTVRC